MNPRVDEPSVIEEDLGGNIYVSVGDAGAVGALLGGCWRIRRSPDIPNPRSCSVEIGDLSGSSWAIPASKETCSFPSSCVCFPSKSPALRFFGSLRTSNCSCVLSSFETIRRRVESADT